VSAVDVRNGYSFALADVRTLLLRDLTSARNRGDAAAVSVLQALEARLGLAQGVHAERGLTLPEQAAQGL
jgi:hypothetical protein